MGLGHRDRISGRDIGLGKPGNVWELTKIQGIVREEISSGKTVYCLLYVWATPVFSSVVVA